MVAIAILASFLLAAISVNGQVSLTQEASCRKQLNEFLLCKGKIYAWKENLEKNNASNALYEECTVKNDCIKKTDDLPHDEDWRKRQCSNDVGKIIEKKVTDCVRLRVSPEFEVPETGGWPYGRFSYESVPLPGSYLESMCKKGNYKGAQECYKEISNRTGMTEAERFPYYDKVCSRRAECYKLVDETCLARYDVYRQTWCECAYDVHDLYGGKRLLKLVPSCAGLTNDKTSRFSLSMTKRDSCEVKDLDERDSTTQICKLGVAKWWAKLAEWKKNAGGTPGTSITATTPKSGQ